MAPLERGSLPAVKKTADSADNDRMGGTRHLLRPILALLVVALAATLLSIPARAGGGDPIGQMEVVVDHMEAAMAQILDEFEWRLETAETSDQQWSAYIDAVAAVEYMRDYKLGALAEIAGNDPELQEAREHYSAIINEIADETLQQLAEMYEGAIPPVTTTTIAPPPSSTTTTTTTVPSSTTTAPGSTTTTTRPRNTTTTNPHQNTTTTSTTAPSAPASTPPTSTVPPSTLPATSDSTTTTAATATSEAAPPPPPTTTTAPSLFDGGGGAGSFAAVNESLAAEQIGTLDAESARLDVAEAEQSATPINLALATAFDAQAGLMDGTLMMVDYVGTSLPGPVAAPVIGIVAVFEMIVRALLSGTQAFVGPALVFAVYAGYRSLVTFVAFRRTGAAV